jgi:hypothetical protein
MKKVIIILFSCLMLSVIIQITGCRKIIDIIFHGHDEVNDCRIKEIKQNLFGTEDFRTGIVYYNSHDNPDSVIFDIETGSAGASLFHFIYDDQNRLIEYREDYSRDEGDYHSKHNYTYENGRIVKDTFRIREAGTAAFILTLHYDAQGRVIKEDVLQTESNGNPVEQEQDPNLYEYDADGNLDLGDDVTYDDKKSFLRTNKLWMFTQRNYSENNPMGATSYNDSDLPLGFAPESRGDTFLQFGLPEEISYECEE